MNITKAMYDFYNNEIIIAKPKKIVHETNKCYYLDNSSRYRKTEIDVPRLIGATAYPIVQIAMIDATTEELCNKLAEWFNNVGHNISTQSIKTYINL